MKANKIVSLNNVGLAKDTVCIKVPYASLAGKQSFVVPEGWEVLVVQNEQLGATYKRGSHRLSPLLKTSTQTQLVYYPTLSEVAMLWGTAKKMIFKDEISNLPIEVGTNGILNFKIKNIRKFYFSFGSFKDILKLSQIKEKLAPEIIEQIYKTVDAFAKEQKQNPLVINFQTAVDNASSQINYQLQSKFGISLVKLNIKGMVFDKGQLKKLERENEKLIQQENINLSLKREQDLAYTAPQVEIKTTAFNNNENLERENKCKKAEAEEAEEGLMLLL